MKGDEHVSVIGIDCAVEAKKCGLALGDVTDAGVRLDYVATGLSEDQLDEWVTRWFRGRAVIALDSPLGWPAALGKSLQTHRAGQPLPVTGHTLFRRSTDTFVHEKMGKLPLDVGSDRIARTAAATLVRLDRWRRLLDHPLPVLMNDESRESGVIEVYPAATLKVYEISYARFDQPGVWQRATERLSRFIAVEDYASLVSTNRDAFDSVVCMLAAVDFLRGDCYPPPDPDLAAQESWIWVRQPLEKFDLKMRSWGASERYGLNPLSAAGRQWAEEWLLAQPWVTNVTDDGAILFPDAYRANVGASVEAHGLKVVAGIGPDDSGRPFTIA